MSKAVLKFCTFLKWYQEQYQNSYDDIFYSNDFGKTTVYFQEKVDKRNKEIVTIENLIAILSSPKEEWKNNTELFNDFDVLSLFLEKSDLNNRECSEVIFHLIQRNLATEVFDGESCIVDVRAIYAHHFETMSNREAASLISTAWVRKMSNQDREELDSLTRKKLDEIIQFAHDYSVDISDVLEWNKCIEIFYFNKKNHFNLDDVDEVIDALGKLKVTESILKKVRIFLEKESFKGKKQEIKNPITFAKMHSSSKLLSDKEYKKLRHEIGRYYDLYHNQPLQEFDFEKMIYCLSLLLKLGASKKEIENYLYRISSLIPEIKHPFSYFNFYYDKILSYQDDFEIGKLTSEVLEYLSDIYLVDDEEYAFVKEEVSHLVEKIRFRLAGRYDYEISCAKKLIKEKEN